MRMLTRLARFSTAVQDVQNDDRESLALRRSLANVRSIITDNPVRLLLIVGSYLVMRDGDRPIDNGALFTSVFERPRIAGVEER
jgi:hypothetical protein